MLLPSAIAIIIKTTPEFLLQKRTRRSSPLLIAETTRKRRTRNTRQKMMRRIEMWRFLSADYDEHSRFRLHSPPSLPRRGEGFVFVSASVPLYFCPEAESAVQSTIYIGVHLFPCPRAHIDFWRIFPHTFPLFFFLWDLDDLRRRLYRESTWSYTTWLV